MDRIVTIRTFDDLRRSVAGSGWSLVADTADKRDLVHNRSSNTVTVSIFVSPLRLESVRFCQRRSDHKTAARCGH